MSASFSSREQQIRRLGNQLETEIAGGNEPDEPFERILRLPVSDFVVLKDTIFSLCEARLGGSDPKRIERLQSFGATAVRYLGLFFDPETINEEFVPRLLEMAPSEQAYSPDSIENHRARYDRITALAQLAPQIEEADVERVLEECLDLAGNEDRFEPDLVLPLASFERTFRQRGGEDSGSLIDTAHVLCLDSVRGILNIMVDALAEADAESLTNVMDILPLVHTAGVSLLTLLPSAAHSKDPACVESMNEILDHSEWLLSRREGFPGDFVSAEEVATYDSVRSVLSLCSAMLSVYSSEYASTIANMRVAKREGPHRVGTVALDLARRSESVDGVTMIRDLVQHHLEMEASHRGDGLPRTVLQEVCALAWHLDVGETALIKSVLNRTRDPHGQFYLHKTLEGKPWG